MGLFTATQPWKQLIVEGRIIRADGTVEELGVISYWHANPLRRWAWRVRQFLRGRKVGSVSTR